MPELRTRGTVAVWAVLGLLSAASPGAIHAQLGHPVAITGRFDVGVLTRDRWRGIRRNAHPVTHIDGMAGVLLGDVSVSAGVWASVEPGSTRGELLPDLRAGEWGTFTGNQLCALLTDFVCEQRKKAGTLTKDHFLVTTLVTTPMIRRIGDSYGVQTRDSVHVGFKWIAQEIDAGGPDKFIFGTEESFGFLIGQYVRDKDGAAACMLMAQLAAACKAAGKTVFDRRESLYWQHGYHGERQFNLFMEGSAGMTRICATGMPSTGASWRWTVKAPWVLSQMVNWPSGFHMAVALCGSI